MCGPWQHVLVANFIVVSALSCGLFVFVQYPTWIGALLAMAAAFGVPAGLAAFAIGYEAWDARAHRSSRRL